MPLYRKKPIIITAVQMYEAGWIKDKLHNDTAIPYEAGDWIITGVQGEQYPCKNDVFNATYEAVTLND